MIQELLGGSGASLIGGEKKISHPSPLEKNITSSPSEKPNQNLRCPRCDSSNTKFCYYNNYNLTQPRHFCKTCRRYWTKGGALRNVPIGGGCRRSKNVTITSPALGSAGKSNTGVSFKPTISCEIGKLGFEGYNSNNNDQLLPSNPILWGPSQGSHILALLRSSCQNPSSNPSFLGVKEESAISSTQALGLGQFNPFWRSNQGHGEQNGFVGSQENHNNNNGNSQDLYQRLRSTGNFYQDHHQHTQVLIGNDFTTTSSSTTVLESAPIVASAVSGDFGYWNNPTVAWSDLPTTNGAYP